MALIYCSQCNEPVSERAAACPACRHPIPHAPSAPLVPMVARVSSRTRVVTPEYVAVRKSKWLAAFCAVLLGSFGIHKFYLDRPGQGLLYALFCWTFVPAAIGVIEGVAYLWMSDGRFQRMAIKL